MSLLSAPGFNASIDSSFAALVDSESLISQNNPLINLRPSSLNLSQNCWAACDLLAISHITTADDDPTVSVSLMGDIQSLAISPLPSASMMNYMEYWTSLIQLDTAVPAIEETCNTCNASGYLTMPMTDLNFTADCNLTGAFYSRYYGSGNFDMDYIDLVQLYIASLPSPYQNMTAKTISWVAASMWNYSAPEHPQASPRLPLKSPYASTMLQAAGLCALDACRGLGLQGDTDIGGIGAVATYFTIAGITTILAFLVIHYKTHNKMEHKFRKSLRHNLVATSIMWWDAITWLTFITLVAALVESLTHPKTLYEAVLTQWTVYLLLNSTNTLWALASYPELSRDQSTLPQKWVRGFIILITLLVAVLSLYTVTQPITSWVAKADSACYAAWTWPLYRAWHVATWFQACMPLLWVIVFALRSLIILWDKHKGPILLWSCPSRTWHGDKEFLLKALRYAEVALSLGALWWNVGSIWMLRVDAMDYFGPSYDDNTFSYGQMLAAGFAAQPVLCFLFTLISDTLRYYGIPDDRLQWLRLPKVFWIWLEQEQEAGAKPQYTKVHEETGESLPIGRDKRTSYVSTLSLGPMPGRIEMSDIDVAHHTAGYGR